MMCDDRAMSGTMVDNKVFAAQFRRQMTQSIKNSEGFLNAMFVHGSIATLNLRWNSDVQQRCTEMWNILCILFNTTLNIEAEIVW